MHQAWESRENAVKKNYLMRVKALQRERKQTVRSLQRGDGDQAVTSFSFLPPSSDLYFSLPWLLEKEERRVGNGRHTCVSSTKQGKERWRTEAWRKTKEVQVMNIRTSQKLYS